MYEHILGCRNGGRAREVAAGSEGKGKGVGKEGRARMCRDGSKVREKDLERRER